MTATASRVARTERYRFGFIMEQTLGHVTHYRNLRSTVDADPDVEASWYPIEFPPQARLEALPILRSNWSARASVRVWRELRARRAAEANDALFFHTQVTTLLARPFMRQVPSIISLDATPMNVDTVGTAYGHSEGSRVAESLKRAANVRSLHTARALVTWCDWARQSLIHDYGADAERISVIPPGVDLSLWPQPVFGTGPVRILFVGGDFARKGGEVLLQAFADLSPSCELHIVSKARLEAGAGIFVYNDIQPNSETLRNLYATADIFVLPTLADCFPLVVQEAMAAGLPVIATDVGAISEAVCHDETGLLVPPGDTQALRAALEALIEDRERRELMGRRGRAVAERKFDSAANARRIIDIMHALVDGQLHEGRSRPNALGTNLDET